MVLLNIEADPPAEFILTNLFLGTFVGFFVSKWVKVMEEVESEGGLMKPIKDMNARFIIPVFIVIFGVCPMPAHASWVVAGMQGQSVSTPHLNPGQGLLPQHNAQLKTALPAAINTRRPQQNPQKSVQNHPQTASRSPASHRDNPVKVNNAVGHVVKEAPGRVFRDGGGHKYHDDTLNYEAVDSYIDTPDGFEAVDVDGQTYFYANGVFYQQDADQLTAIPPVLGAVVDSIPQNYEVIPADGVNYLLAQGVYFERMGIGFQVVVPPVAEGA